MKKALNIGNKKNVERKTTSDELLDIHDKEEVKSNENNVVYRLPENFFGKRDKKEDKLATEVKEYLKAHTLNIENDSELEEEIVTFKEFVWLVKNGYLITYSEIIDDNYNKIKIKYQYFRKKRNKR